MFDNVPKQVLEDVPEPVGIGPHDLVADNLEASPAGLDLVPGPRGDPAQRHRLGLLDGLSFSGQRERVVDYCLHPFECVLERREVLAVAFVPRECRPGRGDVQRVPEVVADDGGEPVETLVLSLELPGLLAAALFAVRPRERGFDVGRQCLRERDVALVERSLYW